MRCPYTYTAWRAYADSLKSSDATINDWCGYLGELIKHQADGRLVSWNFAQEALDEMEKKGMGKEALADETVRVFKALQQPSVKIAEEMNFEKVAVERSLKRFKGCVALEDKVLDAAVVANAGSKNYLPQIFAYAIKRFEKDRQRLGAFWAKAATAMGAKVSNEAKDVGRIDWRKLFSIF